NVGPTAGSAGRSSPPLSMPEATATGMPPLPESAPSRTSPEPTIPAMPIAPFTGTPAKRAVSAGAGQLEFAIDRDSLSVLPGMQQALNILVRNNGGTVLLVELSVQ